MRCVHTLPENRVDTTPEKEITPSSSHVRKAELNKFTAFEISRVLCPV